jgi:hypothetical protein
MELIKMFWCQVSKLVNDYPEVDITVGTSIGTASIISLSKDEITFATQMLIAIVTIGFFFLRAIFAYKKNKREEIELKLKEMEREQEHWEFKKRNGLD